MTDGQVENQTSPRQNAGTVGTMVEVLLNQGAEAAMTLVLIAKAFDQDDIEQAKRLVTNALSGLHPSGGGSYFDLNMLVYESLARDDGPQESA